MRTIGKLKDGDILMPKNVHANVRPLRVVTRFQTVDVVPRLEQLSPYDNETWGFVGNIETVNNRGINVFTYHITGRRSAFHFSWSDWYLEV